MVQKWLLKAREFDHDIMRLVSSMKTVWRIIHNDTNAKGIKGTCVITSNGMSSTILFPRIYANKQRTEEQKESTEDLVMMIHHVPLSNYTLSAGSTFRTFPF